MALLTKNNLLVLLVLITQAPVRASALSLTAEQVLIRAYAENSEIAAAQARVDTESSLVRSKYWLDNPKVGLMREVNMNEMQMESGPMNSWSISQEILFPFKYFAMGGAQSARAEAARQELLDRKLEVRQRVLSGYYGLYALSRTLALLEAQRETSREIARIAETRRATGAVPQQDEMKAHVEQTRIENEILLHHLEVDEVKAQLNASIDGDIAREYDFAREELPSPKLLKPVRDAIATEGAVGSKSVAREQASVAEAEHEQSAARYGYFPDFMLSYRRPFTNSPVDAYAASIELTIPLWFFAKQTAETAAASARVLEAEKKLEMTKRSTRADAQATAAKVETYEKLLKIYETSLIPQATSALNSSRSAYSAGRVVFQELLDAERSLYGTRITYYQTLAKFVEAITELERITGVSLSSLPFGETL